jgi:hypothetical protein
MPKRNLRRVDFLAEAAMFFGKPKTVVCAVCGKEIEPKERRFVDKNRVTKAERHTHVGCRNPEAVSDESGARR